MIFGIVLLLLLAGIAFWHYLQGFFSATLSAIFAMLSAMLAFSLAEPLVNMFKPGKFADSATALALCCLFVVIYLVLRITFDMLIPGNVRLQSTIDKVGAGVMGVIAGLFTIGVIAVAAQCMPFGPDIAGYSRYRINDTRTVTIHMPNGQGVDAAVYEELVVDDLATLKANKFTDAKPESLLIPADDLLVGAVSLFSTGSLSGSQSLTSVHPDFLQEVFGQRIGMEAGAKHSAPNYPGDSPQVTVSGLYMLSSVEQRDDQIPDVRETPFPATKFVPEHGALLLVVRTIFSRDAADSDGLVRFSPANCRLAVHHQDSDKWENYYPVGTLEAGRRLYVNHLDDPLFVDAKSAEQGADLVYLIDHAEDVCVGTVDMVHPNIPPPKVVPGTLLEIKHLGVVDLAKDDHGNDRVIETPVKFAANIAVMREVRVQPISLTVILDPNVVKSAPILDPVLVKSDKLPRPLNIPTTQPEGSIDNGKIKGDFKNGKFSYIQLDIKDPLSKLTGPTSISKLAPGDGNQIIQIKCTANDSNPWKWASDLYNFELMDDAGVSHRPAGGWSVIGKGDTEKMLGGYLAGKPAPGIPVDNDAKPNQVWLIFCVPSDRGVLELRYGGKTILDLR